MPTPRSWLTEIEARRAQPPEPDVVIVAHGVTEDGLPYLESADGLRFHALSDNTAWAITHANESRRGRTALPLVHFSIMADIQHRYFKVKQHRRHTYRSGDVVVELGAYIGYYTLRTAQKLIPGGHIRAVEFMPDVHAVLAKNLAPFAAVADTLNQGVANRRGVRTVYCGDGQRNGFRRGVIEQSGGVVRQTEVTTDTIDAITADLEHIDLCILQINGIELEALQAISTAWSRIDAFAIAANYDDGDIKAPIAIADLLDDRGYATEIFDRWVYARRLPRTTPRRTPGRRGPIFIGGCGRSGTTLLRVMLDSHPDIACGPESNIILDPTDLDMEGLARKFDFSADELRALAEASAFMPDFLERFMEAYAHRRGRTRWAEKTPRNVRHIEYIFDNFPNARFIHVIRDGRDVACSLRTHPKRKLVDGQWVPSDVRHPIETCIARWVDDVTTGLEWRDHPRYIEVRYEDLVHRPEKTLRILLDALEQPWSDAVLSHHEHHGPSRDTDRFPQNTEATAPTTTKRVGRWRDDLDAAELATIYRHAGALLTRLGYSDPPD